MLPEAIPDTAPAPVGFVESLKYWLRLGFISFGGPAGQIAMMHLELVERRRWISERRFLHALNYCMLLPGPEAQQLATYIGWLMHGVKGGVAAGALFVLPSLLILIALAWIYVSFGSLPVVAGILYGIKPAVTAIVVFAAYRIGTRALRHGVLWAIAAAAFVAIFALDIPFPYIVLGAASLGMAGGKFMPDKFKAAGGHGTSGRDYGAALIDDHTPTPSHARLSWARLSALVIIGLVLWISVMALLSGQQTLFTMGGFFTKAALVTFGGAYAVLPYVYQGGVEHYQWLTAHQMIDGLALGETTPGPLIMVVAFVGFIGGWSKALFGPDTPFWAGAAGAGVATFFTFLPSFLFILVGGPLVERTHGDLKFTAPLTAITAAVVGVILNLAVFFAWHTLWPVATKTAPFSGQFEWFSVLVGVTAFIALWRYQAGVVKVIGACALLGLSYSMLA
ncbi:MAG TPA: chromate efflux transporter [Sulfuriferula sp.]|nr:chromate efflux transporter [Sulfuriferula sp.]